MRLEKIGKNQEYLKQVEKRQKSFIAAKDQEIKNVKRLYEKKALDEKMIGENKMFDLQSGQDKEIIEKIEQKQTRLESIKNSLKSDSKRLAKERQNLVSHNQKTIENMNNEYSIKYTDSYTEAEQKARLITELSNSNVNEMKDQLESNLQDVNFKTKLALDSKAKENDRKITAQNSSFDVQAQRAVDQHRKDSIRQKMEHQNKLHDQASEQSLIRTERNNQHLTELQNKENQHKDLLKQKDQSFKQKFMELTKSHKQVLSRIKQRFDSEIKSITSQNMNIKSLILNKSDDPFYEVNSITPTIEDLGNEYRVGIKVAPHERDGVRLTTQGRDITINLNRTFSDQEFSKDGTMNQSKRSESFKRKFAMNDLMDSTKITESYQAGILQFKIPKR